MKRSRQISRRKFINRAALTALGVSTLPASVLKLKTLNAAALNNSAVFNDEYKALICLFQAGGADSFNMLMPRGTNEYQEYATTRSNLAIPQSSMHTITPATNDGKQYGVHPSMYGVKQLFDQGTLAFLPNIGMMVQPTTKAEYQAGSVPLPLGLFSHSDQIKHWQTASPAVRSSIGWGGKVADLLQSMNNNQTISMNISLSGTNVFQYGNQVYEYSVDPEDGSTGITRYDQTNSFDNLRNGMIDSLLSWDYDDIYKDSYVNTIRNARDAHLEFQAAIEAVGAFQTPFSDNNLSDSFKMIAKIIKAQETLGFKRQIFFVNFGGWDHHDDLLQKQEGMYGVMSNALFEFNAVMNEIGMMEQVTTFTASEFGRTLTSNGNGSDHAWGGNVMVSGGAVQGGDFYGTYPSLELDSESVVGNRGVLVPGLSTDEYFAELALWFGVSPSDLSLVFPNITNFYTPGGVLPVGFMNI
jgi:uncharacterized protein (DUF1501 family)